MIKRLVSRPKAIFYVYFPLLDAQVESVNIVGYQTLVASGQYFSTGPTFISVGDINSEWRLGDILGIGMVPQSDVIQFLDPATASTSLTATYVDEATSIDLVGDTSAVGWWNYDLDTPLDDTVFPAGTGFLCNFSSTGVSLTYAGEVLVGSTELDFSGKQYPMFANLTPVDLTLGQLTATGMVPQSDVIQFLSTSTAATEITATYVDEATSIDLVGDTSAVGWWNYDLDTPLNSQVLAAGAAVLGNFSSASVKITFPSPIAP